MFSKFYSELKNQGKFGGIYFFTKPALLITDLDFLKTVLIKDFSYFHDRGERWKYSRNDQIWNMRFSGAYYNAKDDPLSGHLLNIEGDYWKRLREKLTPTFTSGKIRHMLPTLGKC